MTAKKGQYLFLLSQAHAMANIYLALVFYAKYYFFTNVKKSTSDHSLNVSINSVISF